MKNHSFSQINPAQKTAPKPRRFDGELARILACVQTSSRSAVKSALRELRHLANSINTSLIRSYEVDQYIRDRREKLAQQRFFL